MLFISIWNILLSLVGSDALFPLVGFHLRYLWASIYMAQHYVPPSVQRSLGIVKDSWAFLIFPIICSFRDISPCWSSSLFSLFYFYFCRS